jgi:hypothetical protein
MFYSNEITSADNIMLAFLALHYALLWALCQSGKTGTFHCLARKMLREGRVQRVYIICGSHEVDLFEQAKADCLEHNPEYYKPDNTGAVQVYFRQHFKRARLDTTNALIIIDETHLDQGKNQLLAKFLRRYSITMDGNPAILKEKNTYILSVDATPYSEIAALAHERSHPKHVESLQPGETYFGLTMYMAAGLIRNTFDIEKEPPRFAKLLTEHCQQKYALVRFAKKGTKAEAALLRICEEHGFPVHYYTQAKKTIAIDSSKKVALNVPVSLDDAPSMTTVVIFRGCLRAGKKVSKKNIGFVWEGAENSKTDALVQGLPGRMCGYADTFGSVKPLIFVSSAAVARHEKKVEKRSEFERACASNPSVIPANAKNLCKPHIANAAANGRTQLPPFLLDLNHFAHEDFPSSYDEGFSHQGRVHDSLVAKLFATLQRAESLLSNDTRYSVEQKEELRALLGRDSSNARLRNLHAGTAPESGQLKWFSEDLLPAFRNGTTAAENISDCAPITFVKTWPGTNVPHANPNHVYVVFYTLAGPKLGRKQINLESRIARDNGRSMFSFAGPTAAAAVAAGAYCITPDDIENQESFERALDKYLELATSNDHFEKSISCNKDAFRFALSNFPNGKKDIENICARLGTERGVKMTVKGRKGPTTPGFFNLSEISWA